jgi:hypothetical protein
MTVFRLVAENRDFCVILREPNGSISYLVVLCIRTATGRQSSWKITLDHPSFDNRSHRVDAWNSSNEKPVLVTGASLESSLKGETRCQAVTLNGMRLIALPDSSLITTKPFSQPDDARACRAASTSDENTSTPPSHFVVNRVSEAEATI